MTDEELCDVVTRIFSAVVVEAVQAKTAALALGGSFDAEKHPATKWLLDNGGRRLIVPLGPIAPLLSLDMKRQITIGAIMFCVMKALDALPDKNARTIVAIRDALEVPKEIAI